METPYYTLKSTLLFVLMCKNQNDSPEIVYDEVTVTLCFCVTKAESHFSETTASISWESKRNIGKERFKVGLNNKDFTIEKSACLKIILRNIHKCLL